MLNEYGAFRFLKCTMGWAYTNMTLTRSIQRAVYLALYTFMTMDNTLMVHSFAGMYTMPMIWGPVTTRCVQGLYTRKTLCSEIRVPF